MKIVKYSFEALNIHHDISLFIHLSRPLALTSCGKDPFSYYDQRWLGLTLDLPVESMTARLDLDPFVASRCSASCSSVALR